MVTEGNGGRKGEDSSWGREERGSAGKKEKGEAEAEEEGMETMCDAKGGAISFPSLSESFSASLSRDSSASLPSSAAEGAASMARLLLRAAATTSSSFFFFFFLLLLRQNLTQHFFTFFCRSNFGRENYEKNKRLTRL
jgi:hypothetical protein